MYISQIKAKLVVLEHSQIYHMYLINDSDFNLAFIIPQQEWHTLLWYIIYTIWEVNSYSDSLPNM